MATLLMSIKLPDINNSGHKEMFIGNRSRLATCTGVRLIDRERLVATSLVGQRLYLVRYDLRRGSHEIVISIPTQYQGQDVCTDLLDFDGKARLATSNCKHASITLYELTENHIEHRRDIPLPDGTKGFCHGVRFIPERPDLICATTTNKECFCSFISIESGELLFKIGDGLWRVKDICFVEPGLAVILYASGTPAYSVAEPYSSKASLVAIDFAAGSHCVLDTVAIRECHVDACQCVGCTVYVSNSSRGSVLSLTVDGRTLRSDREFGGYDVPHGVDLLPKENILAVTDYIRNTVELTRLEQHSGETWPNQITLAD